MPKCSDVMTRDPVTCVPTDGITRVAQIMKEQDVGSVPVVDAAESRRLVGIVTDRDIVIKLVAQGRGVEAATVRDAMTNNPTSCRDTDDVESAFKAMAQRQVRRMPIVERDGRLVGIIAQADVATRVHLDEKTGELVEAISEPHTVRR